MSEGGKRVWPVAVGMAVFLLLASLGFWAWHRQPARPLPVVWRTAGTGMPGRRDPTWLVELMREAGEDKVRVMRVYKRDWLRRPVGYMGEGGGTHAAEVPGGPLPFLMMDEEDGVYVGFSNGEIRFWAMKDRKDDLKPVVLGGAERARVVAMYLKKMGKAWPEEARPKL